MDTMSYLLGKNASGGGGSTDNYFIINIGEDPETGNFILVDVTWNDIVEAYNAGKQFRRSYDGEVIVNDEYDASIGEDGLSGIIFKSWYPRLIGNTMPAIDVIATLIDSNGMIDYRGEINLSS